MGNKDQNNSNYGHFLSSDIYPHLNKTLIIWKRYLYLKPFNLFVIIEKKISTFIGNIDHFPTKEYCVMVYITSTSYRRVIRTI